jgi:hypothetical protein
VRCGCRMVPGKTSGVGLRVGARECIVEQRLRFTDGERRPRRLEMRRSFAASGLEGSSATNSARWLDLLGSRVGHYARNLARSANRNHLCCGGVDVA